MMNVKDKATLFLITLFSLCTLGLAVLGNVGGGLFFGFLDLIVLGAYYNQ
jgi:hypothetical protein